jgi:hypothetical protein
MATVKKSMKSAPRKMRPVAPARKGAKPAPMMQSPMSAAPIMKKGGKMKKAQSGDSVSKAQEDMVKRLGESAKKDTSRKMGYTPNTKPESKKIPSIDKLREFRKRYPMPQKFGGVTKKAKSGDSFPDLNKDGKVTKADILKGRGVIAKKGASVSKKCKYGCK